MTILAHVTHLELPLGVILYLLGVATGVALAWAYRRRANCGKSTTNDHV